MAEMLAALVIDDDEDVRQAIAQVLEEAGYVVVQAPNGEEALKVAREQILPDVILLDIAMPVMNGWEFMSARLAWPELVETPVILMSGMGCAMHAAPRVGAVALLSKPCSSDDLLRTVERARASVQ